MDFEPSDKVKRLQQKLCAFMDAHVYPAEKVFERQLEEARAAGRSRRSWRS